MGAGGVVIPPIGYWEKIQAVLNKYDILLVADEVICGFGRTGKMFGSETFNMRPDIMVLSKALASSYQPIAALLINDRIFQSIEDESNSIGTLGHGFTAGGHPVAAAVALENIRIIEEDGLVENAQMMGKQLIKELKETSANPLIGEVRGVGLMAGVALATNGFTKLASAAPGYLGGLVALEMQNRGVIVRNAYDTIVFCPPLIINSQQVTIIAEAFKEAIGSVAALLEK
jgi:4-aminobutyrate--pyruvate transaminase